MRTITVNELLEVWEEGQNRTWPERAVLLLEVIFPNVQPEVLAQSPVGLRDAQLLTLREQLFGPYLNSLVACPQCSGRLELTLNVTDLKVADPGTFRMMDLEESGAISVSEKIAPVSVLSFADYEVDFRLPNSQDLIAISGWQGKGGNGRKLLERCLIAVRYQDQDQPVSSLPVEIMNVVMEHMAQADPQSHVQLPLVCPVCSHSWLVTFDTVSFLWRELDTWAQRILHDVHVLAQAYGWRETDILALSPWRRQYYLQMVRG